MNNQNDFENDVIPGDLVMKYFYQTLHLIG
jgi:hypothetical protein